MDKDRFKLGLEKRKATLGAVYVEKNLAAADDLTRPFQEMITRSGAFWAAMLPFRLRSIPRSAPARRTRCWPRSPLRAEGYRTHSAKIGGTDAAADIARIEALEAVRPAGEDLTFDVNRAWTPSVAVQVLNSIRARGWIERPCETLEQCARVPQPILLNECLLSFDDHLAAWRCDACEGIKVNRLGGLTRARQERDLGLALGWRMWRTSAARRSPTPPRSISPPRPLLSTASPAGWASAT
jgi:hypothetical protein